MNRLQRSAGVIGQAGKPHRDNRLGLPCATPATASLSPRQEGDCESGSIIELGETIVESV